MQENFKIINYSEGQFLLIKSIEDKTQESSIIFMTKVDMGSGLLEAKVEMSWEEEEDRDIVFDEAEANPQIYSMFKNCLKTINQLTK